MAELKIEHAALRKILQGYLDPVQTRFQCELGDVPIGQTGLMRRMWEVNYLSHYAAAINRFARHRFARNFAPTIRHELWTAQTAWIVEVLRLLDEPESKGKKRPNLTIALYHCTLQDSGEVTDAQKAKERVLYSALTAYHTRHDLKTFRNRQMFHLDFEECLAVRSNTWSMEELTLLMIEWFAFSAGIVTHGEPRYVTRGAPMEAKASSKSIVRMMLDSIRFQVHRGFRQYRQNRYGPLSNEWSEDSFEAEEERQGFALAEKVMAEMRKTGQEIQMDVLTERSSGRPRKSPRFTCPDKAAETEFVRRFNVEAERASHSWSLT